MKSLRFLPLILASLSLSAQSDIIWSPSTVIASNQYGNMHPRVVTDGAGNPLVIWGQGNSKQVFFSRWSGNGFTTPVSLNPGSIPVFAASWAGPDLASFGDTVYVVFKETPEDASGIYVVHSFDAGLNFSVPIRVDDIADSISRFPAIGTDAKGNPLVAFMKFDPGWGNARYVVANSKDYGATFEPDLLASQFSGGEVCSCCPATLTHSGNTVALLYRDNLNDLRTSWAGISLDGGNTFANGMEVDNTNWMISSCPASGPDGVIIGDQLYSVFMSGAGGKTLCYRSRSDLNTMQMELTEPLTNVFPGLSIQNYPRIAASGQALAIAWPQTVNGNAQLALQFTDNIAHGFPYGYSILADKNVENTDLAISNDGRIYVVWEDNSTGTVKFKSGSYTLSGVQTPSKTAAFVRIFPNPAIPSSIHIQFDLKEAALVGYKIYNLQGQELASGQGQLFDGNMDLNVSSLQAGSYFIRIDLQGQSILEPIILE